MVDERGDVEDANFGALLGRLFDDGRTLVKAELGVHLATVKCRVMQSKVAVGMILAAVVLANAAVIVLLGGIAAQLATWIGPAGGAGVTVLVTLLLCYVLVRVAIGKLAPKPSAKVNVSIEELAR